jgi:hypothetical protein
MIAVSLVPTYSKNMHGLKMYVEKSSTTKTQNMYSKTTPR